MLEAGTGNMNSFENLTPLQKMLVRWTGTEDRRLLIEFHEGRTEGVRKIAKRFGVNASTVQAMSRSL
jgi:hypothetical protein